MNRKLLTAGAVCGLVGLAYAGSANATVITGSYSLTELMGDTTNSAGGGPVVTGDLGTGISNGTFGTSGNFSFALNVGQSTAVQPLALFNPDPSCQGTAGTGPTRGCLANTETDPVTLSFTFTSPSGAGSASDTGVFTARYTFPYLACDPGGDGAGKSDCVTWTTGGNPIVVNFTDGAIMDIALGNAADWAITPTVQFTLVAGPTASVPEPATFALFGLAVLGLGMWNYRVRQAEGVTS